MRWGEGGGAYGNYVQAQEVELRHRAADICFFNYVWSMKCTVRKLQPFIFITLQHTPMLMLSVFCPVHNTHRYCHVGVIQTFLSSLVCFIISMVYVLNQRS
jgi:hypothetical protein